MDSYALREFGKALLWLERCGPLLDDLLAPVENRRFGSGRIARARPGPCAPVQVSVLDIKRQAEAILARHAVRWAVALRTPVPSVRTVSVLARWMQETLPAIIELEDVSEAARDVIRQADVLEELFPHSDEVVIEEFEGTCRQVTSLLRGLGFEVTRSRLQRWVASGDLSRRRAADGRVLIRAVDVVRLLERYRVPGN